MFSPWLIALSPAPCANLSVKCVKVLSALASALFLYSDGDYNHLTGLQLSPDNVASPPPFLWGGGGGGGGGVWLWGGVGGHAPP